MELFIRIKDGQPFRNPIMGDNFRQAFPDIDTNNLPSEFAKFERVEMPVIGAYQILVLPDPTYELVDGIYKDVWHIREMTAEEKSAKQQAVITAFNSHEQASNWSAWTLDEATCMMVPPIPRPIEIEGVLVMWCGADNNWKEVPARPEGEYKFDFFTWNWVTI
jgi:hypothetical protein